jgi:SAM-dependent methyltransferase
MERKHDDLNTADRIRDGVREAYGAAAADPGGEHPFPVGRRFAESLGYPADLLDSLPEDCAAAFSGVSNLSVTAALAPGAVVLDLGCGAGLDSLIAARRVGPAGRVIGIDFSEPMLDRARRSLRASGTTNLEFRRGDAERLPLPASSVDVALVNGIFNLNPGRAAIFAELARVLRPGGTVFLAELVLKEPPGAATPPPEENWFA